MAGHKQEEIYQSLLRVWNFEFTTADIQEIPGKDCFLQDIRTLGKELTTQLATESTAIGQALLKQTLTNIHYMVNDLLEVRTYKIMEAARTLKKINESILFDMEISYFRTLYTAFRGYSKIRNMIVDGQEITDIPKLESDAINIHPPITIQYNNQNITPTTDLNSPINPTPPISSYEPKILPQQQNGTQPTNEIVLSDNPELGKETQNNRILKKPELTKKAMKPFNGKYMLIRILKPTPALVGEDFEIYGPFQPEDIINLPYRNAKILLDEKMAKLVGESG
jgi:hypothetical protein